MDLRAGGPLRLGSGLVPPGLTQALAAAVTAQMKLGRGDMLAHAEQYAAQTGRDLEDALRGFGLERPRVPHGWECLWQWFWELSAGRGHNGFGPLPLTWPDVAAWAEISGITLQPWQAAVFRAMDAAWLEAAAKQQQKKN